MTVKQWLDRCRDGAYFAAMGFWKSLVIVVLVSLSYIFTRRYFPYIAIFGALLWISQYLRSRGESDQAGAAAAFAAAADLLGLKLRPFQRSIKFRRGPVVLNLSAFEIPAGAKPVHVVDLASPTFRKVPFCFLVRSSSSPVKEAQLVENSRIPGIKFEYQLKPVDVPAGLESAANMEDLFESIIVDNPAVDILEAFDMGGGETLSVFFNGRVLHTHFILHDSATHDHAARLLDKHTGFHLTLLEILDNVDFKVPV